jgi:hypothetical protein
MLTQHPELTHSVESVATDYNRGRAVARVGQPAPPAPKSARRVGSRGNGR